MSDNLRRALFGNSRRRPSLTEMAVGVALDHLTKDQNRQSNLPVDPDLPIPLQGVLKWSDYRIVEEGHDTECWIWENGKLMMSDPDTGQRKDVREIIYHRLSREKLPKGAEIITRCGNYESRSIREHLWTLRTPIDEDRKPNCINPAHFSVISKSENDAINQIRHRKTKEVTQDQRQTIAELIERHDWTERERYLIFNVVGAYLRDDARAYRIRSLLKLRQKDYAGIIADCDQAIALDPDYRMIYSVYATRGHAKSELRDFAGAIADCDQAIALKDNTWAYTDRGRAKTELGDFAGAIADFDQAIALYPDNTRAHNDRDIAIAKLGGRTESITEPAPSLPVPSTVETETESEPQNAAAPSVPVARKSKTVAGWLALVLGGIGAHKFYLGYTGAGVAHLLLSLTIIGAPVNALICIVEFLIYLSKSDDDFHQTYVVNKRRFF